MLLPLSSSEPSSRPEKAKPTGRKCWLGLQKLVQNIRGPWLIPPHPANWVWWHMLSIKWLKEAVQGDLWSSSASSRDSTSNKCMKLQTLLFHDLGFWFYFFMKLLNAHSTAPNAPPLFCPYSPQHPLALQPHLCGSSFPGWPTTLLLVSPESIPYHTT